MGTGRSSPRGRPRNGGNEDEDEEEDEWKRLIANVVVKFVRTGEDARATNKNRRGVLYGAPRLLEPNSETESTVILERKVYRR